MSTIKRWAPPHALPPAGTEGRWSGICPAPAQWRPRLHGGGGEARSLPPSGACEGLSRMCHLLTWRCRARRVAAPAGQGKRWVASSAVPRDSMYKCHFLRNPWDLRPKLESSSGPTKVGGRRGSRALRRNSGLQKPGFLGTYAWPGAPKSLPRPVFCGLGNFPGGWRMCLTGVREGEYYLQGTQSRCWFFQILTNQPKHWVWQGKAEARWGPSRPFPPELGRAREWFWSRRCLTLWCCCLHSGLKEWSGSRVLPRGARSCLQGLGTERTRRGLLCRSPEDRGLQRGTEEKAGSSGFPPAFDTQQDCRDRLPWISNFIRIPYF